MQVSSFGKIAGAGFGSAAVVGGATIGAGLYGREKGTESWALLGIGILACAALGAGISVGARVYTTDPVKGAAIFAAGLGSAMGYMWTMPIAAAIANPK